MRDRNNNSITKVYTLPSASTFSDGKLKNSSIKVSNYPVYKDVDAAYKTAKKLSGGLKSSNIKRMKGTYDYGVHYRITYNKLAKSRTYFTQIAITAPNGYLDVE